MSISLRALFIRRCVLRENAWGKGSPAAVALLISGRRESVSVGEMGPGRSGPTAEEEVLEPALFSGHGGLGQHRRDAGAAARRGTYRQPPAGGFHPMSHSGQAVRGRTHVGGIEALAIVLDVH